MKSQQSTNAFVKETFMDLKTQLETVAKNHQASIQNLETKFDRLADKESGLHFGFLPSNTQPNPKGHNSKVYQPPQSRNENVNVVFTRSGKSYNPPVNSNDQQTNHENPINFDNRDEEDEEPTPQPKIQNPKPVKETTLPKPYKPKIPDESSAMIQNKVPSKLGDPGSFLIPCNCNKTFSCNALSDLGASINLMPYSLYAKLSLENLKPTKISVRLVDRSFQYLIGIAENMLVEVGKFTFLADFVILEMEEDSKVPLILGRPFLHTADAPQGQGGVLKKIDRVMGNMECIDTFPGSYALFQPYRDFKGLVAETWDTNVNCYAMYRVVKKLKLLKKPFCKLLKDQGHLHKRVANLGSEDETSVLNIPGLFSNRLEPVKAGHMVRIVLDTWDIMGGDVCIAVREFFSSEKLLKEINHTIIALLPKIITNRIKEGLNDIVSDNQSAFVLSRRIIDNILITQELMHNYHLDRGPPRCAFKVDIQKAYDTID
ncbi:reverse transcriptase domain-containing protein [Tanacetum coccineum]